MPGCRPPERIGAVRLEKTQSRHRPSGSIQGTLGSSHRPNCWSQEHKLRELTGSKTVTAVEELIALAVQSAVMASQAPPGVRLATLADLT